MKTVTLMFEDDHFEALAEAAREASLSLEAYLMTHRASSVRPRKMGKIPGRPPESPQVKRIKQLARQLDEIYESLRTGVWAPEPEKFRLRYGPQIAEYKGFIVSGDIIGLETFFEKRPWTG